MAKQTGLGDRLFIDGFDISGDIGSLARIGGGPAAGEITGIDKSAFERIGGKRDGGIDFSAWFNDAVTQAHPVLAALPTGSRYVTYLRGAGIGSPAASCYGKQINYDPTRGEDASLAMGVSVQGDGYGLEWGEQLTAGIRTDVAATSPATGLDGIASTAFGGQLYLQAVALTGTSATVTIQDSADNATFAAIGAGVAFTPFTTRGAQRIAFTGTVRRYVRAITTGTFTNAQFVVAFVRNQTLVAF